MIPKRLEEHLELTLTYLPTCFSQLAFLSSVRDPYTGRYLHEGWVMLASPEEVHSVLQRIHREIFELVLGIPLPAFCGELRRYLESLAGSKQQTLNLWLELETFRDMIPEGISCVARDFFLSQMKIALKTLIAAPDWSQIQVRSAWQRPLFGPQLRHHLEN